MRTVFLFISTFICLICNAQQKFHLNSYNEVNCLKVHHDNLWVGTSKGLVLRNKYSGEICGIFNASNSPIPTNNVYDLEVGPQGELWIATQENIVRFDGAQFHVQVEGLFKEIAFNDLGQLMTATRIYTDICTLNYNLGYLDIADGFVSNVVSNTSGQNYLVNSIIDCFGTASGGSTCWQEYTTIQSLVMGDTITIDENSAFRGPKGHVNIDAIGNLYTVFDQANELKIYELQTQTFESFSFDNLLPFPNYSINIYDSAFDTLGNLWMAGNIGIVKFDGSNFVKYNDGLLSNNWLNDFMSAIETDAKGNIYSGSSIGGLYKLDDSNATWEEVWLDGFLTNRITNISSNSFGMTAFDSHLGLSIFTDNTISSFHEGNSIVSAGNSYVDESGRIFLRPENNNDTLLLYDGTTWSILDPTNSNLSFFDFEFVFSNTQGEVWIQNNDPSNSSYKVAKFNNGLWINYTSLDSLYLNTPLQAKLWDIVGTSAMHFTNNDTIEYPIPSDLIGTNCLVNSIINNQGIGLAAVFTNLCDDISWHYYDLLYFDGTTWTKIAEPDGQWDITEMGFRGDDIYFNEIPEFYQCGQARLKIVTPDLQIQTITFPLLDSIYPGSNELKQDFLEITEGTDGDLWIKNTSVFGDFCQSYLEEYINNRSRVFRVDNSNQITQYESPHCSGFEDEITTLSRANNGFVWNRGLNSIYTINQLPPLLEVFTCTSNCANSMVSCVTSGGIGPFNYEWSGMTTPFAFDLEAGTYSMKVSDALAQSTTVEFETPILTPLNLNLTLEENDTSNQIIVDIIGGTAPYSYLWSTGSTNSVLENPAFGTYSVTITDVYGCTSTEEIMIVETNTQNIQEKGQFLVFPNPVKDLVNVQCSHCNAFRISSPLGKNYSGVSDQ